MENAVELTRPRFAPASEIVAGRSDRAHPTRFEGLWVTGTLAPLARKTVAVVGARAPSEAGRNHARALGEALARAGVCVISGLALGIDAAAHAGCLAGGGATIGVLGGGHRRFYPHRNRGLAAEMVAAGGAVLSPFAPDEPARPWQFLERNAVVAALADVVVVVEAAARSGALNTASWATALGIDVLAYPGDVDRPKAAGCNALIRDGAVLARGPEDVFEALGMAGPAPLPADGLFAGGSAHGGPVRSPLEQRLLARLAAGPAAFDDLVAGAGAGAGAGAAVGEVAAALVTLEIAGAIRRASASTEYALA